MEDSGTAALRQRAGNVRAAQAGLDPPFRAVGIPVTAAMPGCPAVLARGALRGA